MYQTIPELPMTRIAQLAIELLRRDTAIFFQDPKTSRIFQMYIGDDFQERIYLSDTSLFNGDKTFNKLITNYYGLIIESLLALDYALISVDEIEVCRQTIVKINAQVSSVNT